MNNFKRAAISLFILLMVSVLYRPADAQMINYGLKGGVNFSSMANSNYRTDYNTGYHFSFFVNYTMRRIPLSIQPEMYYSRLGTKYDEVMFDFGAPRAAELDIDYIQIPVIVKIPIPVPGPVHPNLFAGPYAGFVMGTRLVRQGAPGYSINQWVSSNDFGIVFGLGADIPLVFGALLLELRMTYGLENVYQEFFEYQDRNRAISISTGFSF